MIELADGLVVPRAPGPAAVAGDERALVAAQNHALGLVGIDPQFVIVIATGRAFPGMEGHSAVTRDVGGGVHHIDGVGIFRIHAHFPEIPAASPDAMVGGTALPIVAAVVGAEEATLFGVHD